MLEFSIRRAGPPDYAELGEIMFEAVQHGTPQYTEVQRLAWVAAPRSGKDWQDRLNSQAAFVAEAEQALLGFMTLKQDYLDFAYIRPAARGTGMFRRLYKEIEALAYESNTKRIWTHSSLTAQPAFTSVGFCTTTKETVKIGSVALERFEMEKLLVPPTVAASTLQPRR